ncbi:MAG: bile acid:sodium symporter family protein [Myxococcales bacterium]|nr:bile acid:sodium symporter family protein [Myxococcales bacterium]
MESTVLTKVVLPLALFVIMLGMGLALSTGDFKRVSKNPKAFLVGLWAQMLLLPAIGFAIATALSLPPMLAVGLMILALCPGGTTSNLYAYLAKGDLALSISLTAVASLIAPFSLPIIGSWALHHFMGDSIAVSLPLGKTIIQLIAITVLPVGIGMLVRAKAAGFADRAEKPVRIASVVFLVAVIAGIIRGAWSELPDFFADAGLAALLLNLGTMATGFALAKLARLSRPQSITIGLEVGLQNGTTALLVTGTILANPVMSIPPAVYSIIMFITGAIFSVVVNMGAGQRAE